MLAALWFVPSANASQDASQESTSTMTDSSAVARTSTDTTTTTEHTAAQAADTASETTRGTGAGTGTATQTLEGPAGTRLADTGSIDTTPYVVGGTLLLGLGAGFVAYSVRRERTAAY